MGLPGSGKTTLANEFAPMLYAKRLNADEVRKKADKYSKWAIFIGPEGGFTTEERKMLLNQKNIIRVTLGNRILRSDTAAIASLFCVQSLVDKRQPVLK